jgi:hypothetical protein
MTNNFFVECPNGHGSFSGYLHPEIPLEYKCPNCAAEMVGHRTIQAIEKELQ